MFRSFECFHIGNLLLCETLRKIYLGIYIVRFPTQIYIKKKKYLNYPPPRTAVKAIPKCRFLFIHSQKDWIRVILLGLVRILNWWPQGIISLETFAMLSFKKFKRAVEFLWILAQRPQIILLRGICVIWSHSFPFLCIRPNIQPAYLHNLFLSRSANVN